ncbi:MAG TPA: riboflavin synthase [Streptosporangiaceae bacterium]|nr:riboflavin synthase [Streptosporangiaceae bacterium]
MFTGIVEELGAVVAIDDVADAARLTVRGPRVTEGVSAGDSISVSGVCLTVVATAGGAFTADVMRETLNRSSLSALAPGTPVNLERAVRLADRLGGHLVQGHVDGTGTIVSRAPGERWDVVRIALPPGLSRYVVEKGSVAVDGISLTVSATGPDATGPDAGGADVGGADAGGADAGGSWFEVSLIPETLKRTTLGAKEPGETVNLEVDVIAKYVEKLLAGTGRK